jgi:ATP-binding cassette, subfamily B, bacterial HlyB/CyaB
MERGKQDSGLECLTLLLRYHRIAVDPGQISHQFAGQPIGVPQMLRCAKDLKLKARATFSDWFSLSKLPLPAIVELENNRFIIVASVTEQEALVQDPAVGRPQRLSRPEFEKRWTGRIVLMTRRASLSDLTRRFDISWFITAIHKYRRLLSEVLVASFFLQLFALVTPLFFQVVTDKVLTHRGFTTLDVLMIGLVTVSIFETVLGALRTYVFAHTTNRIDVELGARLFRHLVALPISYFEARRAGDSVARVRELENIRNFLTGSALTLVIDLVFTVIIPGGDVLLLAVPELDRGGVVSVLYRPFGQRDAGLSPAVGQEVQPRRREPGLSGRERQRDPDAQGDGDRTPDAEALGGATCSLCRVKLRRHRVGNNSGPLDGIRICSEHDITH